MRLPVLAQGICLALSLLACSTPDASQPVDTVAIEDSSQARLPEVRYYVIADT